ncbi:MAG: MFS transporter [Candidatus Hodarchaeales archaeon]|jgi:MFS family permease
MGSIDLQVENLKSFIIIALPSIFVWVLATSFILIFGFDLLAYVETNNIKLIGDNDLFTMLSVLLPFIFSIIFTGIILDKEPKLIYKLTTIGILGCSLSLLIGLFSIDIGGFGGIILSFDVIFLGFFLGLLANSSTTLFGAKIKWNHRAKGYSIIILFFSLSILIIIFGSTLNENTDYFLGPGILIGIVGIIISTIVYLYTKNWDYWINDDWPTKISEIINRRSVQAYFISNSLIWLMCGLAIGILSQQGIEITIGEFDLGSYKSFWAVIFLGVFLFSIPAGFFSDWKGRKLSIILAIYGIVFASLIVGLLENSKSIVTLSALIIGISFAFIHSTLDMAVWFDLSPGDSRGRYSSLSFLSIGLGFGPGFIMSYFLPEYLSSLPEEINQVLSLNVLILVGLGVLAIIPLIYITDSFPPLNFFLLIIMNDSGIPLFHYTFNQTEEHKVDLSLISGALTAIGSFMIEATGDITGKLNLVRHGTQFIISSQEGDLGLSGAIFANKNDPELQTALNYFMKQFAIKFSSELKDWIGDVKIFEDAVNDAERVFGPLVTIID